MTHPHPQAALGAALVMYSSCGHLEPVDSPYNAALRAHDATPGTAPDGTLAAPAACGQCGGPAAADRWRMPVPGRFGDAEQWRVCGMCQVTGVGPHADRAVLVDVLNCTVPHSPGAALLALRLMTEPAPHPVAQREVGWAAYARRMDVLGPYHRVVPTARAHDAPGRRWGHLPAQTIAKVVSALQEAAYVRTPCPSLHGTRCPGCGTGMDLPGRWTPREGRMLCGTCADLAALPADLRQLVAERARQVATGTESSP